jgi:hypothetical protein
VGILNASQTVHTKFMVHRPRKYDYGVMNISADAGFMFGIVGAIITLYYFIEGHESLTLWNFFIAFIVSTI